MATAVGNIGGPDHEHLACTGTAATTFHVEVPPTPDGLMLHVEQLAAATGTRVGYLHNGIESITVHKSDTGNDNDVPVALSLHRVVQGKDTPFSAARVVMAQPKVVPDGEEDDFPHSNSAMVAAHAIMDANGGVLTEITHNNLSFKDDEETVRLSDVRARHYPNDLNATADDLLAQSTVAEGAGQKRHAFPDTSVLYKLNKRMPESQRGKVFPSASVKIPNVKGVEQDHIVVDADVAKRIADDTAKLLEVPSGIRITAKAIDGSPPGSSVRVAMTMRRRVLEENKPTDMQTVAAGGGDKPAENAAAKILAASIKSSGSVASKAAISAASQPEITQHGSTDE